MGTPTPRSRRRQHRLLAPLALLLTVSPATAESISGVCPDGSIFIVQRADAIPCRSAKRVDPGDIPPLQPEYLPRPYGWEVFNRESDPYNPYNVIDAARPAPTPRDAPAPVRGAVPSSKPRATTPPVASALRPQAAPAPQPALSFALAPQELEDLVAIVAVRQQTAPAAIVQRKSGGRGLTLLLARSNAFEARVSEVLAARGATPAGPILAFHVQADTAGDFWGNLTFVQGHVAFHPDTGDVAQFGLVEGKLGQQAAGERVLGYVVLPPHADTGQPLDVYWNDRIQTAVLTP